MPSRISRLRSSQKSSRKKTSLKVLRTIAISLLWQDKAIAALQFVMNNRKWSRRKSIIWLRSLPPKPEMRLTSKPRPIEEDPDDS